MIVHIINIVLSDDLEGFEMSIADEDIGDWRLRGRENQHIDEVLLR